MGKTSPCEKYELAITNYVIGEKIDIPQKELFDHLAQCLNCQGDLRNWKATYATMRAREYDARPEVKQKTQKFIKSLVSGRPDQTATGDLNLDEKVGEPAGVLWHALAKNGEVNILDLPRVSKLEPPKAYSAFGWLACEKKVRLRKDAKITYVSLAPSEKEKYREEHEYH